MLKRSLFLVMALVFVLALAANAKVFTVQEELRPARTVGNESGTTYQYRDDIPFYPPGPDSGVISQVMAGVDYNHPLNYTGARHVEVHPTTIMGATDPSAIWVVWETGDNGENDVYSAYYDHLFGTGWENRYKVSFNGAGGDAGRPMIVKTDNDILHSVYHVQLIAGTAFYHIGYNWHSGAAFTPWNYSSNIIITDDFSPTDQCDFPTACPDGNNLWVHFRRTMADKDVGYVMYGTWDEGTQEMSWGTPEYIDEVANPAGDFAVWSLSPGMFVDDAHNLHIAYGLLDTLCYKVRYADGTWSDRVVLDIYSGDDGNGAIDYPSITVDETGEVHVTYLQSSGYWYPDLQFSYGRAAYVHGNINDGFSNPWLFKNAEPPLHPEANTSHQEEFNSGIDANGDIWVAYHQASVDRDSIAGTAMFLDTNLFLFRKPFGGDWYVEENYFPQDSLVWLPDNVQLNYYMGEQGPVIVFDECRFDEAGQPLAIGDVYAINTGKYVQGSGVNDHNVIDVPKAAALHQNYPNPFNPETEIAFDIAKAGHVSLRVYNSKGELVNTLVDKNMEASYHTVTWNGKDSSGAQVPSGVYMYTLKVGDNTESKSMVLLK